MYLRSEAIIVVVRAHGEHGAIVRGFTPRDGVQPGFVRGGRSTRLRPILQPANTVLGEWRSRTDEQLAALTVELVHSRAGLHAEPLAAAALEWLAALTATALPEAQPYPRLHSALCGVLDAIEAAPAANGWATGLVRYELLLLAELGFGLDLDRCIVTGDRDDLAFVSPKSGGAVSRRAAMGHEPRMLPLPLFLRTGGAAGWDDILDGLRTTRHFLARDILVDRRVGAMQARDRLVDRIKRAVA